MENIDKQELKKRAEEQEELIKIINNTEIKFYREVDIPKTDKGITNKAKELLKKYKESIEKKEK